MRSLQFCFKEEANGSKGMLLLPSVILCYFWRVAAHSLLPVIVDTIVTSRRHQLESDRLQTGSSSSSLSVAYIRLFVHIDCQECRDINFITEADIDDDTAVEKDACTVAFTV
ncbi:50S ribosomal protein [Dirofilaria immitis]